MSSHPSHNEIVFIDAVNQCSRKKNAGEIIIVLCRRAESCSEFSFGHSIISIVLLPVAKH